MKYLILSIVCTSMLIVTIQRRTYEQTPRPLPLMAIGSETNPAQKMKLDFTMPARVREIDESTETRFAIQVRCLQYTRTPNTEALFDKLFSDPSSRESVSGTKSRPTFKSRLLRTRSIGPSISKLLSSDQGHLGQGQTRIVFDGQPAVLTHLERIDLAEEEAFQQCASAHTDDRPEGDRHLAEVETFDWKPVPSIVMTSTMQSDGMVRLQASVRSPGVEPIEFDSIQQLQPGQTIAVWGEPVVRNSASTSIVPVLGNIPIIGKQFQKTTITTTSVETVYLITAELIPARASNQ